MKRYISLKGNNNAKNKKKNMKKSDIFYRKSLISESKRRLQNETCECFW